MSGTGAPAPRAGYGMLRGEWDYWKLCLGETISRFGDSVDALAFTWLVFQLTGSASMSAMVVGVNALPTVVLQPLAAPLVERMNKKRALIISSLARALLVALTAALFMAGLLKPWMLLAFTFLTSTLEAFAQPAAVAAFPMIVRREAFTPAMALSRSAAQVAELAGTAAVGLLIAVVGVQGVLIIDCATFLCFAAMAAMTTFHREWVEPAPSGGEAPRSADSIMRSYLSDLADGFKYLISQRVVLTMCLFAAVLNGLLVPLNALLAAYTDLLGLGAGVLSLIGVSVSLGMLIASASYPFIAPRVSGRRLIIGGTLGIAVVYLGWAALPFVSNAAVKLGALGGMCLALGGVAGALSMLFSTASMRLTMPEYLARASSVRHAMSMAVMPFSAFAIALMTNVLSITTFFVVFAVFIAVLGVLTVFMKALREL